MAEKTLTIKKDTLWKIGTIVFAVLFIISLVWNPFGRGTGEVITGETTLQEQMCSSIRGTPSWADSEGIIIASGYRETYSVDDLIEDKIYYLYHPGCGWCQKQITFFGEDWQKYIDSGYTVDCSAL
ncbi:hypothetical protein ES703_08893 [subsurface metagenome]